MTALLAACALAAAIVTAVAGVFFRLGRASRRAERLDDLLLVRRHLSAQLSRAARAGAPTAEVRDANLALEAVLRVLSHASGTGGAR